MKCDQCSWAYINGVFCHEQGCPNRFKYWDVEESQWVEEEEEDEDRDDFHQSRYMEPSSEDIE